MHQALGRKEGLAFLDTSDIELGKRFPPELMDALLDSRAVVVFASEDYETERVKGLSARGSSRSTR